MNAEDLRIFWDLNFSLSPPIGYLLRKTYQTRWFRIHTLPDSKRYPDSEKEFIEILRRHNAIIEEVLEGNSTFVLLSFEETFANMLGTESSGYPPATQAFKVPLNELEGNSEEVGHVTITIWMRLLEWQPSCLDPLLRFVALDKISNLGIVNTVNARLYFPYDGGGDVILSTKKEVMQWKNRYNDWLSKHPTGL